MHWALTDEYAIASLYYSSNYSNDSGVGHVSSVLSASRTHCFRAPLAQFIGEDHGGALGPCSVLRQRR